MSKGEEWPPWGLDIEEETIYEVGRGEPVEHIKRKETTSGSKKLMEAFETIRENYDQLNHDDEREAIEGAIGTIEEYAAFDFEEVAREVYPNSRAMHALEEGELESVQVDEGMGGMHGLDRVVNIQMQVVIPLETL